MTNSYKKTQGCSELRSSLFVVLLLYEPAVVPTAVKDTIDIHSVVLYLIKDKVPLFHIHFVIFVGRNAGFIKKTENAAVYAPMNALLL